MSAASPPLRPGRFRHSPTLGVYLLLGILILYWSSIPAEWGAFDVQSLMIDALPLCFAAMAQAVVIISGGIDLSVGALMALVNVLSAKYMVEDLGGPLIGGSAAAPGTLRRAILVALVLILIGLGAGALTGLIITVGRIPDLVVTLAMTFVWGGLALLVLGARGGGVPPEFGKLGTGTTLTPWLPTGLVVVVAAVVLLWVPIRWTQRGREVYAIGSRRETAFRSARMESGTTIRAYALAGAFAALGGLALTATSGVGDPLVGDHAGYALSSIAAAVLGGCSLRGGAGGLIGPIAAAVVLTLVQTILILEGVDDSWARVIQAVIVILVIAVGGLVARQRGTAR